MTDGVKKRLSELPGIFAPEPSLFRAPERKQTERTTLSGAVVPQPKQINRAAMMLEIRSLLDGAKRFAESMPADAAKATVTGTTDTLHLLKMQAVMLEQSPASKTDLARFQALLTKVEKSLSTLAAAVQVRAREESEGAKKELVALGSAIETALQAVEAYDRSAGVDPAKRAKLSRTLHEIMSLSPAAKSGGYTVWSQSTIHGALEGAAKFRARGFDDCATAMLRDVSGAGGSFAYELRACEEAVRMHLATGSFRGADESLRTFEDAIRWAKEKGVPLEAERHDPDFKPRTIAELETVAKELRAQVAALESADPTMPAQGTSHVVLIEKGRSMIPKDLIRLAAAVFQSERDQVLSRMKIRELSEQIRKLKKTDPQRKPLEAERNQHLAELAKKRPGAEAIKRRAIERMDQLRNTMLEKSSLTKHEAATLAATVSIDASIPREERPTVRDCISEFLRLGTGRGIGTLQRVMRRGEDAAATIGDLDIGAGVRRSSIWHELGHHFEYTDPKLRRAALDWLRSRATHQEAKTFAELHPDAPKDVVEGLRGFDDHFISYYVGRIYDRATEVFSVGMQHFHDPAAMLNLLVRDADHFALMLGALEAKRR